MTTKIGIVNVSNFDNIIDAIINAIKLVDKDLPFSFKDSKYILLKPNLLSTSRDACTQPIFVEGVINYLKSIGVSMENVRIGDSPGQLKKNASSVAKKIGLFGICEKLGIEFVNFEGEIPEKEVIEDGLIMKEFFVSKPVKDCDIIINLPKLKTHVEATMTGAIKNYWGIIPGGLKAKYHLLGKNAQNFGMVLADNFSWVVKNKPNRITIYDLHTIMQGPRGPSAGEMVKWDLILVGTDELALDLVALEIGKFNGLKNVPHLNNAFKRGLGIGNFDEIEILGLSLEDAKKQVPKFKVPGEFMTNIVSFVTGHVVYKIFKKIPVLKQKLCKKCGECAQICPAEAINFKEQQYPIFLRKKCISCLCCMEMCPHHAIDAKMRGIGGLLDFF